MVCLGLFVAPIAPAHGMDGIILKKIKGGKSGVGRVTFFSLQQIIKVDVGCLISQHQARGVTAKHTPAAQYPARLPPVVRTQPTPFLQPTLRPFLSHVIK